MAYHKKNNRPPRPGEGRPKETIQSAIEKGKLPENWKEIVFTLSSKGASETEIRAELIKSGGINAVTIEGIWRALQEREEEFLRAIKICRVLCQAWWEAHARENLEHSKERVYEAAVWFMNMKNRFGWRDKTEIDHGLTDETWEKYASMPVHEIQTRLKELGLGNRISGYLGSPAEGSQGASQAPRDTQKS